MSESAENGVQEIAIPKGLFVQYAFYKVDAAWRLLPHEEREEQKAELTRLIESVQDPVSVRTYSLAGIRADADLLLWTIAPSPVAIHQLGTAILGTAIAPYLRLGYAYLAMTKRSIYVRNQSVNNRRLSIDPKGASYLFVYPFVKTRPWYRLSMEERQRMMNEHIRIGHKYPSVKLNTTYSFGLDDQEFVVAFETDKPEDFVDLVMELREAESSLYTLRDTPIFTCIAMPIHAALDCLDGVEAGQLVS
ncbi:MAG: chlorite dismutase family protein [Dehalococcoidia bacterium]